MPGSMRAKGRILWISAAGLLLLAAAGLALYRYVPRQAPSGQPALVELTEASFGAFSTAFDEGQDGVQVVVLLSPT